MLQSEDVLTLKADGVNLTMMFEVLQGGKISDFELKLIQIDSEQLGIPDTEFSCSAKLSSQDFCRISKDLLVMGDTVVMSFEKDGLELIVQGDVGTGYIHLRDNSQSMDVKEARTLEIRSSEARALSFSLKYLNWFCKGDFVIPLRDSLHEPRHSSCCRVRPRK